ncbi:tetratricopeptide repeat protein [Chitinophagaceae bacterium MMS25-I14]
MKNISVNIAKLLTAVATGTALLMLVLAASCSRTGSNEKDTITINGVAIPKLLPRKTAVGPENEKATIDSAYSKAIAALQANPEDDKQYINIASAFITEGRVTGNGSYYGNAAVSMLNRVIDNTPNTDVKFQALSLKSAVLLNMHQFKDALATAQEGVAMNAYNAGIYGAMVDAHVELGDYDAAVKDCDQMLGIRPDLRSYSRASYLRQIHGDNAGAIAAMKMAVEAGVPGTESAEWARVTLGDLYLNTGKADSAQYEYKSSLVYRPGYPYAEMGLARLEKTKKNYDEAIVHTKNAIHTMSEVAFVAMLGDLYELKGDKEQAAKVRGDVVKLLEDGEKEQPKDAPVKHNAHRELANAYLAAGNLDKALQQANEDLAMRPENIDANELVAWIQYQKGDYANARIHADKMLRMNTKNATSLYKASLIYAAAGETTKANDLKQLAATISPYADQKVLLTAR